MDAYPLTYDVTPPEGPRNRLTSAFRVLLAIPHILIVGSPGSAGVGGNNGTGVFGAVASIVAVIAWFAILFTGTFPRGLWDLSHMYMRWRARAIAYMALLRDEYPPFGDDDAYPTTFALDYPEGDPGTAGRSASASFSRSRSSSCSRSCRSPGP